MINILPLLNLKSFQIKYSMQKLKHAKLATNTDLASVKQRAPEN